VFPRWRSFWRTVWGRRRFEDELDEELRFHLEARAADLVRDGVAPGEARRRARLELGAVEDHKEEVRRARGVRLVDELVADLRFALRGWSRQRGVAVAVTAILTIGIAISTTVFTLLNALALRPPIRSDPASFAKVYVAHAVAPERPDEFDPPEIDDLLALEGATRSLAAVAGARRIGGRLGNEIEDVRGVLVTCDYFSVVGQARPLLGRLLDRRDCAKGETAAVMVLDEGLWRRMGADPALVGQVITFERRPFTVVGVLAGRVETAFKYGSLFVPYTQGDLWPGVARWERRFETSARLRPGFSRADAAAELNVLLRQQDVRYPGRSSRVVVTDGSEISRPSDGDALARVSLILGLLAMIVLLVCSNVVSLLLARAHARRHEIAVRLSLGAGRGRLMRMLTVETLPLAVVAGGLSLLLSHQLPGVLVRYLSRRPRDLPLEPDWRVWSFVAGVSLLAALASGLAPALEALKVELVEALKGRPAGPGGSARQSRVRDLLVVGQIAVTVVLLVGAGFFLRGYASLAWEERGFDSRHTLVAPLRAPGDGPPSWSVVHEALGAELRGAPGIEGVAFADAVPPGGQDVWLFGSGPGARARNVQLNSVSPEFFATLGLRILRGRGLLPGESTGEGVVPIVVSRSLARAVWRDNDPLQGSLRSAEGRRFEVVGVAEDITRPGKANDPAAYRPLRSARVGAGVVLARFSGDAAAAAAAVDAGVRRAAPGVLAVARTIQSRYDEDALTLAKFASVVLVVGGCALLIALVGVYGTVAFTVRRRTREMGIRVALGAGPRDVVRALVTSTAKAVGAGLLLGMVVAFLLAPGLRSMTGELAFRDPVVYGGAVLLLGAAAAAAMLRPVLRALALDQIGPASVLRDE
jgi:predicted permease